MQPVLVKDLYAPSLSIYRSLKCRSIVEEGLFVAEGLRLVEGLLKSCFFVNSLLLTPSWYRRLRSRLKTRLGAKTPVYLLEQKRMSQLVGFPLHQGLLAVACIPESGSLTQFARRVKQGMTLVALDGVQDAENVGLIIRNCAAFGVEGVLVSRNSCSPFHRRAARVSMGGIFQTRIFSVPEMGRVLRWLQEKVGFQVIAADIDRRLNTIGEIDFAKRLCVVLGNEADGLSPALARARIVRTRIPIARDTDSLNVACACAVILYQLYATRKIS